MNSSAALSRAMQVLFVLLSISVVVRSANNTYTKDQILAMDREDAFWLMLEMIESTDDHASHLDTNQHTSLNSVSNCHEISKNSDPPKMIISSSCPSGMSVKSDGASCNYRNKHESFYSEPQTSHPESWLLRSNEVSTDQRTELIKLYDSTNGPGWTINDGWDTNISVCMWYGVTCEAGCTNDLVEVDKCPITDISLNSNRLEGTLPELNLPDLETLSLRNNSLSGLIPLLRCPKLSSLVLLENNGLIYPKASLLKMFNTLNGAFWSFKWNFNGQNICLWKGLYCHTECSVAQIQITACPLLWITVPSTNVSGVIHSGEWLKEFPYLTELDFSSNSLSGTLSVFQYMPQLRTLKLARNKLDGSVPSFNNLRELTTLDLSGNKLTGTLSDFSSLSKLTNLNLQDNLLHGSIPVFSQSLISLNLDGNKLEYPRDPLLGFFNEMHGNEWSRKDNWIIEPSICKWIGITCDETCSEAQTQKSYCPIRSLSLPQNNVAGTLQSGEIFSSMKTLQKLNLSSNLLAGNIPALSLPLLEELDLENNPDLNYPRSALERLYQNMNGVSWTNQSKWNGNSSICEWFGVQCSDQCPQPQREMSYCPVVSIALPNNRLSGNIDANGLFTGLSYLQYLDLSSNGITGDIPVLNMAQLQYLNLEENPGLAYPKAGLEKFFQDLQGQRWLNNNGWNESAKISDWFGISCDSECTSAQIEMSYCPVTSIGLKNNNLSGLLSAETWKSSFTKLSRLDLSSNSIKGHLIDFKQVPLLEVLDLSSNRLSGIIPEFLLQQLRELKLNNNSLSGTVPSLQTSGLLEILELQGNTLTGEIPLFKNPFLQVIDLKDNQLKYPRDALVRFYGEFSGSDWSLSENWLSSISVCDWHGLECLADCLESQRNMSYCGIRSIVLTGNSLKGELSHPKGLFEFPDLLLLDLSNNTIEGTLPDFSANPKLIDINLSNNFLAGGLPNLSILKSLFSIDISGNMITGTIPRSLPQGVLSQIFFQRNHLTGSIPDFVEFPNLQKLDLSENRFTGSIPIFKLPLLKALNLEDNSELIFPRKVLTELYDSMHGSMWNSNTNWTRVDSSPCDWMGIACHQDCTSYQRMVGYCPIISISLSGNNLFGYIEGNWTTKFTLLEHIDMSNNSITGTIPDFSALTLLKHLDFSENHLTGSIPGFDALYELQWLELSNNSFTDLLPDFQHLRKIEHISMSGSSITPAEILSKLYDSLNGQHWKRKSLWMDPSASICEWEGIDCSTTCLDILVQANLCPIRQILLPRNNLTGSITSFGMSFLEVVDFSYNNIGLVSNITTPSLTKLDLSHNMIRAISWLVSESLTNVDIRGNQISYIGNWHLPSLVLLDLKYHDISGVIENIFLEQAQVVDLRHNQIEVIMNIQAPKLFTFFAGYNQIRQIWNFDYPNVFLVNLEHNMLAHLPSFEACQSMNTLDVSNNLLQSMEEQSLYSLEILKLSYNYLRGPLPELNNPNLRELYLSQNRLDEKLPSWGNLTNLEVFDLYQNDDLQGPLPDGMDSYRNIDKISILDTKMQANLSRLLPATISPSDSYQLESVTDVYQCPTITNPSMSRPQIEVDPSYYAFVYCNCLPGYFGFGDNCYKCPENSDCTCSDGTSLQGCYITPNITNIVEIVPCLNPSACKFSIPQDSGNRTSILEGDYVFECQEGYTGRGCSECQDGYIFEGSSCSKCSVGYTVSTTLAFVGILTAGIILQIGLTWIGESDDEAEENENDHAAADHQVEKNDHPGGQDSARVDIFLFYAQILQLLGNIVDLPQTDRAGKALAGLASFKIPSLNCWIGNRPHITSLVNISRIPGIMIFGWIAFARYRANRNAVRVTKVISVMFVFFEATYFSVAQDVISAYGCTLHDEGTEKWYLNAFPWIECTPMSVEYAGVLFASIPGLIYLVAYPLLIWKVITVPKAKQSKEHVPSKHVKEATKKTVEHLNNSEMNSPSNDDNAEEGKCSSLHPQGSWVAGVASGKKKVGIDLDLPTLDLICCVQSERLAGIYDKECDWWVVTRIVQSLLFGFSAYVIPYTNPGILHFTLFIWIQASMTLQNIYQPYKLDSDDHFSTYSWLTLYISFFGILLSRITDASEWISWAILSLNGLFIGYFFYIMIHEGWISIGRWMDKAKKLKNKVVRKKVATHNIGHK